MRIGTIRREWGKSLIGRSKRSRSRTRSKGEVLKKKSRYRERQHAIGSNNKESRIKNDFRVSSDRSASSTIHDSKYRNRSPTNRNGEFIALSEALRLKSLISKTEDFPTHRKINESKRRIIIINTPTELKGGRNISNL